MNASPESSSAPTTAREVSLPAALLKTELTEIEIAYWRELLLNRISCTMDGKDQCARDPAMPWAVWLRLLPGWLLGAAWFTGASRVQ